MILRLLRRLRACPGRAVEAQRFQRLFLLGCDLAVLVLAVEHMTLVDMRCAFVQMQRPVQYMNVVAKLGLELVNELGDDVQQILAEACSSNVPSW